MCSDYNKIHKKLDQFEISLMKPGSFSSTLEQSANKQDSYFDGIKFKSENLKQKSIREAHEAC